MQGMEEVEGGITAAIEAEATRQQPLDLYRCMKFQEALTQSVKKRTPPLIPCSGTPGRTVCAPRGDGRRHGWTNGWVCWLLLTVPAWDGDGGVLTAG